LLIIPFARRLALKLNRALRVRDDEAAVGKSWQWWGAVTGRGPLCYVHHNARI
jgi:hypothetical protein